MDALIPCPECRSRDVFRRTAMINPRKHSVKCNYCALEIGLYDTEEEATAVWNGQAAVAVKKPDT